ncbi:uncharacterized protein LOC106652425 [Trichogramma pretiosum]|uniref:uncharacterized protein LOC106652425 n=1 Tax=Trichogramma pretiosum TaxID=7493 RepID=UPI000C718C27|nr:uncharacterized protein LOC106652425 [Trichogramma pretiosum]
MSKRISSKIFIDAVANNSFDEIQDSLSKGADVNVLNDKGETALHVAITQDNVPLVKFLLDKGANLESRTKTRDTALHLAVADNSSSTARDNLQLVSYLLTRPFDVRARNIYGETALHNAVKFSDKRVVELLLVNGFQPNDVTNNGSTALHYALCRPRKYEQLLDIISLLMQFGAEINVKNKLGATATYLAFKTKIYNKSVINYLLDHNADINCTTKDGFTLLFEAIRERKLSLIKYLLEHGANIHAKNNHGENLIHFAIKCISKDKKQISVVKLLLEFKINVNEKDLKNKTPLHYALKYANHNLVKLLIENGSFINCKTYNGESPLTYAIRYNKLESVKFLLSMGINPNGYTDNNFYQTYLTLAVKIGNKSIVELLIDHGANVNSFEPTDYCQSCSNSTSPLSVSISAGNEDIMKLLVSKGANVNSTELHTGTPLHHSVRFAMLKVSKLSTIQYLLDNGADVTLENTYGNTALMIVSGIEDYFNIACILIKHMAVMSTKGDYIGRKNMEIILNNSNYLNFYNQVCIMEISQMEKTIIDQNIKFSDVLLSKENVLVKCIRNKKVQELFQKTDDKTIEKFPNLWRYLSKNLKEGKYRLELVNRHSYSLLSIISCRLPLEIATKICFYLSNEDLKSLGYACKINKSVQVNLNQGNSMKLRKKRKFV